MDDSSVMRDRVRPGGTPKGSLLELLEAPTAAAHLQAEPEARGEGDRLPKPGDPYRAYARAANQAETTLHVMDRAGYFRGFSWAGYDGVDLVAADHPGGGPVLVLRFDGMRPTEVVIEGRNLGVLHSYLGQNRVAWIRELPAGRESRDDAATVISRIEVRPALVE